MSINQMRFRLNDDEIDKFNKIMEDYHLQDRNKTLVFLIENFTTQKEIIDILQDIRNVLVGTTLSSREAQKKSTFILDMLNAVLLNKNNYSLALSHEKKSTILKRSEANYNNQLKKYQTKKIY